jgi:hypothetical protein
VDAPEPPDPTRRSFIQAGAGVVVGAGRQLRVLRAADEERARLSARNYRPTYSDIELRVNGNARALRVPHQRTLLLALARISASPGPRNPAISVSVAPARY